MKFKLFEEFINEFKAQTIDVSMPYNNKTMYDFMKKGRKDVMFLNTIPGPIYRYHNEDEIMYRNMAIQDGFKEITFKNMYGGDTMIIHADNPRALKKAKRLAQIAKSHGGFLQDQTPEEAAEIGRLLDYREIDIQQYIDKYNK